ncbi:unnamed protein product [Brassicogethes aeneus]|uniref:C2HC/C3H-type domain-containing protein n=1 Tax=Brassicogethes aeneus TaxID=1431903 RepID=A0A9P0AY34_BRAAE|nr:unnamed protein product [Brassicogethes aeneus]
MSRLAEMQARFQQKQMQEKEEKLLRLYENQQQRAFDRVGRGSAGSNTSVGSTGGGKVRQMFDERRQKAGVDRSYPLEPLKSTRTNGVPSTRNSTSRTVVRSTVSKSVGNIRNGKPSGKTEVVQRIYNNNNGDESYEEHRFEDDNYRSPSFDLIELMNRSNIHDDLDNEILPQIGFDDVDEPVAIPPKPFRGKLSNVGGKLPSQSVQTQRVLEAKPAALRSSNGVARKQAPPASVKKTARTTPATTATKTPPTRSPSKTQARSSMSQPVPNTARPSAKQPPKQNPSTRDDLAECKICHRRFAEDRLAVHENICLKSAQSKRKKYDATKHRLQGTDLEQYGRKILKGSNKAPAKQSSASKKDWRKAHEEFIAAIRSAKQTQAHLAKGGKLSDLPPPPPSSNPDYVQCPHCGRRFNESAAERHIPKCANYQYNKPNAPAAKPKPPARR